MRSSLAPLDPPRRLLMGSGPSNPEPRVLQALASAPVAPDDPAFRLVLADFTAHEHAVFQTTNRLTVPVPGASRAGIEAVLASLIEVGDRVLVGTYGHFGELLCTLATRHGGVVERVEAEWGTPVDVDEMIHRIRRQPPRLVAIVHADTSTGILQPLERLGSECHAFGVLFVVDAVLSLGGCEVAADPWCMDAAIGGLQKCLGGPPGLALVTCSERACDVMRQRRSPPDSAYLDLSRDRVEAGFSHMLFAGREALRLVHEEGLERRWERHRRAGLALRAGIEAMGLSLFGDPAHAAPMIALVRVPDGVDEPGVREQLLRQHAIEIMAAFGPLRGRVWRIGTMGTNARVSSVLTVLAALEAVLASRGVPLPRGEAIAAALGAAGADPSDDC
jgi:(S)-ureidoglycine---glyoxylate transaminase